METDLTALVPITCPACDLAAEATQLDVRTLVGTCSRCGRTLTERLGAPTPPPALPTRRSEGCRVLDPGERPEAARLAAAQAWVATADQIAARWGPAAHAQLTAYPAVAAWYGHRAAELALPSPW